MFLFVLLSFAVWLIYYINSTYAILIRVRVNYSRWLFNVYSIYTNASIESISWQEICMKANPCAECRQIRNWSKDQKLNIAQQVSMIQFLNWLTNYEFIYVAYCALLTELTKGLTVAHVMEEVKSQHPKRRPSSKVKTSDAVWAKMTVASVLYKCT